MDHISIFYGICLIQFNLAINSSRDKRMTVRGDLELRVSGVLEYNTSLLLPDHINQTEPKKMF